MRFYNTLTRSADEFESIEPGKVRMYTCGPTVYDYAHIGNFRAYVFEDILRRTLKFAGYSVTQVMNLTDVDDKTIRGARAAGKVLADYTQTYKDAFFSDLDALNIERAEVYPAATDHVPEMIALIERLIDNGHAYRSDDGSVYYKVASFANYGKLARVDLDAQRSGERVASDEYDKDSVADFALWKAWDEEDGDVVWDSPWGRGRPGWHIECSAMGMKYLGESFDIHTGGVDNMFPHHDNEIAQSEGATGKPFVGYWLHCGYLVVGGEKMSKSLGNFHTLRDLVTQGYKGREVRYVLLSAHYRQPLNFTLEALGAARASLQRLDEFRGRLVELAAGAEPGDRPEWLSQRVDAFGASLEDDLNTPEALGALFGLVTEGNKAADAGTLSADTAACVLEELARCDSVLGFGVPESEGPPADVVALVVERQAAREARDWATADRCRDDITAKGWVVKDTPDGPRLRSL